jgi:hypothetical protein
LAFFCPLRLYSQASEEKQSEENGLSLEDSKCAEY